MTLPEGNEPRGRTGAPASVAGVLGQPVRPNRLHVGLHGWRRRYVVFRVDTLAPAWDTLFFVVPLDTPRSRYKPQAIRCGEVKRQRQEER